MKKQSDSTKRQIKDKRFYTYTAFALTAAIFAIVVIVTAAVVAKDNSVSVNNSLNNSAQNSAPSPAPEQDKPTDGLKFEDFLLPVEYVSVIDQFGFFYNQTLNSYYEHKGIDFTADAGEQVLAAQAGKIESIYTSDLLSGTQITVDHGNGVKSVYRFVEPMESLSVGDEVKRGEVIACVADATGDEYKEGAHLHFEVMVNNQPIDPATYLTLAEK